jgi:hypothetical protein
VSQHEHGVPDWLVEASLAIFVFAIVVMGIITAVKRVRKGPPKPSHFRGKARLKAKRRRGKH